MSSALNSDEFGFVSDLLRKRSGLALTADKTYLVESRLQPVAKAYGLHDVRELIALVRRNPPADVLAQLVEAMTTNESMFLRDMKPFEQLVKVVLPVLAAKGRNQLRIWSAACSTGQEPYSIAMMLKEEAARYPQLTAEIYATDIAHKVLTRARAGIYSQFEVQRGLPITLLMKYFTQASGNCWEIHDALKDMVTYASANLLTSYALFGRFDVIFCRNVLIYFDAQTKIDVLERMAATLHPPGYLFLGSAETSLGLTGKLKPLEGHRGLFTLAK